MFNRTLSLKEKVIIFSISLIFLIIVSLLSGIWGLYQIKISKEHAMLAVKVHTSFQELRLLFEKSLMGPHDYLITGEIGEKEVFLADYKNILEKKKEVRGIIRDYRGTNNIKFDKILNNADEQLAIIEQKLPVLKNKLLSFFNLKVSVENTKIGSYMEEMDLHIREVEVELEKEAHVLLELSNNAMNQIHTVFIKVIVLIAFCGIIATLLGVILSYFLIRSITMPINKLIQATMKIKEGDLTIRADIHSTDEIGQLAEAFNNMVENLKNVTASRNELNKEIEERQKAEKQFKESQALLIQAEKMGTIGTMTAGIAHELNNPMMGVLNFIQYCIKHTSRDNKIYEVLLDAVQEAKRCIDILRDLLSFTHMEREGEEDFQRESISEIFETAARLLTYKIEKSHVTIRQHIDENTPKILMRVNSMQQVLFNILLNALDAIEDSEQKEIDVTIRSKEDFVEIIISDSGPGIEAKNMKKIFEPFFTTKPPGSGTGLGLSVCRNIIKMHRGKILCDSKIGEGTQFIILLPLRNTLEGGSKNSA
ncbi:MAG: ATP-binding protein [bacterium]